jgi:hypothetical protein
MASVVKKVGGLKKPSDVKTDAPAKITSQASSKSLQ